MHSQTSLNGRSAPDIATGGTGHVIKLIAHAVCGDLLLSLCACGGGGDSQTSSSAASSGGGTDAPAPDSIRLLVSDDSAEDWATIGVKVLSIALVPQGGGSAVTVYTAPSQAPMINLEELDQLAEILGNVSVPAGTYTGAIVTVGGNPGDVALTVVRRPRVGVRRHRRRDRFRRARFRFKAGRAARPIAPYPSP